MRAQKVGIFFICLTIGGFFSYCQGQDVNWDLLNYHLINPYLVFTNDLHPALNAAGLQSYFNPTLDFLYYFLSVYLLEDYPRLLAFMAGLPYGLLLFVTLHLSSNFFSSDGKKPALEVSVIVTAVAATGAATLSQAGTTFNEVTTSALILAGVLVSISERKFYQTAWVWNSFAIGGILFGLAAGFKLTAFVYAPAFCLSVLISSNLKMSIKSISVFSIGWSIGFLIPAGWWCFYLYREFGSPVYPFFNALFKATSFPPMNFLDDRFLPHGIYQWLFYPLNWFVWNNVVINAELGYRDPRLTFALASFVCYAIAYIVQKMLSLTNVKNRILIKYPSILLTSFAIFSYIFWIYSSAIMRYAIIVEVMGTLCFMRAFFVIINSCVMQRVPRAIAMMVVGAGCIAWTKPPDYGHLPYGQKVFDVDMSWAPLNTLFVPITGPTAYVLAFVSKGTDASAVGFGALNRMVEKWELTGASKAAVQAHQGPIFVLIPPGGSDEVKALNIIGINPKLGPCRMIQSNLDGNRTQACQANKLDAED